MGYHKKILAAIKLLSSSFNKDEIAYLALTSKIENPIRDKIAYIFHSELCKGDLISREWDTGTNKRVDLAILDKDSQPKCLIEFKAHSSLKKEEGYKDCVKNELNKLANVPGQDAELYYIFLCNLPHSKIDNKYSNTVKYYKSINSYLKNKNSLKEIKDDLKISWDYYTEKKNKNTEIISIKGGVYYGIKVTIQAFIYGPFNKNNILNNSTNL